MSEKELRKLYGEDYIPQSQETLDALCEDEYGWLQQYADHSSEYDLNYVRFGIQKEAQSNG